MTGRDLVALSLLPSGRRRAIRALAALPPGLRDDPDVLELLLAYSRGEDAEAAATAARLRGQADVVLDRAEALGISAVLMPEPAYPAALRAIPDPPPVLWVAGRPATLAGAAVAIVGSRAASEGGLVVAERLGRELAGAGVTVVSGLARGCDAAAHRGALAAGGATIAVLGCGVDIVYPAEHAALCREIVGTGAVVSELPPGTPPLPPHFPQRNRIISGLSRAVVVVEASEKSGSLITAACALEQGRDVMAVPGSTLGSRYRGCHALLRDGARLVETATDVLDELGLGTGSPGRTAGGTARTDPLLRLLGSEEDGDLDALVERSGLPVSVLLQRLLALELAGEVRRAAGGRFVRARR